MTVRPMLAAGAAAFALAAMGADSCATTNTTTEAEKAPASKQSAAVDAPSSTTRQAPDPAGDYDLNCAYELGDFGESGDPSKGYRFIAGGTLHNTGNVGIRVRATYKWKLLGQSAMTVRKTYRLRRNQERDVNLTIPVTSDDISAHQNADADCSTKVSIIGTFGPTPIDEE